MNYFLYKVYGGDPLFSESPAGEMFVWSIGTFATGITFSVDDVIIAYSSPNIFYMLEVKEVLPSELKLVKRFELVFEKHIDFNSGESLRKMSDSDYMILMSELLSEYVSSTSPASPNTPITSVSTVGRSENTIYYGAPGTGKSYKVDKIIKDLDKEFYERITFHPEYDNASFVGGYKPVSGKDDQGNEIIRYEFVPQAFTEIYKRAWSGLQKGEQYYLVVEEINRGNCAEIFGEIFQLLDRNSDYTVSPSSELKKYLETELGKEHPGIKNGLKLPPNLAILATMNTSDQSLFPMDSAFKRRWEWEYVPVCYDNLDEEGEKNRSFDFVIDLGNGTKYSWIRFIEFVNLNHIKENPNLGMDKCIGNYFVKPEAGNSVSLKHFVNKVIFYLWNDVFKEEENGVFEENGSYEDFFPITSKGLQKVTEMFDRIGLDKTDEDSKEEPSIEMAAEPHEPYGE